MVIHLTNVEEPTTDIQFLPTTDIQFLPTTDIDRKEGIHDTKEETLLTKLGLEELPQHVGSLEKMM